MSSIVGSRYQHSTSLFKDAFQVLEARDGMGRQARLRRMLDTAQMRRSIAALAVDEVAPLQATIAHVKDTAPVAMTSAGGSITHTGTTVGSALFLIVNYRTATSISVNIDGGSALTALKTQTCSDSPQFASAIYMATNLGAGSHTFNATMVGGVGGAMWTSEYSGMYSATLDKSAGNGANNNVHGAGPITPATAITLAILVATNSNSGWTATTLPTQGGTWTSIATSGFTGVSGFGSGFLITSSTTAITPVYTGDASSYEHANVLVNVIPGSAPSPPVISSPTATSSAPTTVLGGVTTDTTSGTLYAVVDTAANLSGIIDTQIIAGQKASGAAALSANNSNVTTTTPSVTCSGLTGSTLYTIAFVQVGSGGNSNVSTTTFTTHAPIPVISGVSSMNPLDGSALTITGTGFGSSQGSGSVTLGGTTLTVTSWGATSIIATVARGTNAYGLTENLIVTDNALDASSPFAITTIQPASGRAFVNLTTPNATSTNRITAVPDLVSGMQLVYDTLGATVTINSDGTFVEFGQSPFNVGGWLTGNGWGADAVQTINQAAGGATISTPGMFGF